MEGQETMKSKVRNDGNSAPFVNKPKVYNSIFWYAVSLFAYYMMETFNQGLNLQTSKEMFWFSIYETLFMVSMAGSYFYSWQTYSGSFDGNSKE